VNPTYRSNDLIPFPYDMKKTNAPATQIPIGCLREGRKILVSASNRLKVYEEQIKQDLTKSEVKKAMPRKCDTEST
jgi:hypothetical protein